jgi:hypothetical protein
MVITNILEGGAYLHVIANNLFASAQSQQRAFEVATFGGTAARLSTGFCL